MEAEEKQAEINATANQKVDDRLDKPIGSIEQQKLEAVPVLVLDVDIKVQTKKDKVTVVGDMVHVLVKHPEKDEPIDMTKCIYLRDKKVRESGLWYNEDADGNLQKGTALCEVLNKLEISSLKELKGLRIPTEMLESGYLGIKAY